MVYINYALFILHNLFLQIGWAISPPAPLHFVKLQVSNPGQYFPRKLLITVLVKTDFEMYFSEPQIPIQFLHYSLDI